MLELNKVGGQSKSIVDRPDLAMREASIREGPKKGKASLIFKIILVLVIIGVVYYLFRNPDIIRDPVNKFFGRFS